MSTHLPPGTYRLTQDLPAIFPDKRKRHDWRAAPMLKGTLFVVAPHYMFSDVNEARLLSGYIAHTVRQADANALFNSLEPVVEKPSQWLMREHAGLSLSAEILDELVSNGFITLDQIKQTVAKIIT